MKEKQAIRQAIQEIRDLIPSEERKAKTQEIAERFYGLKEYCDAKNNKNEQKPTCIEVRVYAVMGGNILMINDKKM